MRQLPNFITSLNLVSGFIAIIFAAKGEIVTASWLILAAMIFDFLDGFSARLLNAYSAIGKELDSLADVVSFGVAPAFIIYHLLSGVRAQNTAGFVITLIPAIMAVCAAIRLAVFNLDPGQSTSFKGLPVPANALMVISLVIAAHYSHSGLLTSLTGSTVFLIIITILLSLLMVSRMPLFSLKITNFKIKGNEGRYLLAILVILSYVFFGIGSIPFIIPLYILSSAISLLF